MKRLILAPLILLAGCTQGPDFQPTLNPVPAHWPGAQSPLADSVPTTGVLDAAWWQRFHDATLNQLLEQAVAHNLDLRIAAARVLQARALRLEDGAAQQPNASASSSYSRARNSAEGLSDPSNHDGKAAYNYWDSGLSARWEIDLWGRLKRQVEAADATLAVAEHDRHAVLLSLLGEVARDYISLRQTQATQAVTRDNLALARQTLQLSQRRQQDGVASQLDVAQAATEVASQEAALPLLEQQQGDLIDRLGLLLDAPPQALGAPLGHPAAVPETAAEIGLGLPSELAQRRPDIQAADARLHAATAAIGVAQADFYPSIRLSADLGLQALQLSALGDWSARRFATGPVLYLPLFDGGRLKGALALRQAQQQEAALNYRKTVLSAWHEIAQRLRGYNAIQLRRAQLAEAVKQGQIALAAARRQYQEGAVDLLTVLSVQRTLLASQQQWVASQGETAQAVVALYCAVGGGWEGWVRRG